MTLSQRYQIQSLLQVGYTQTQIAIDLGVHKSSINREFKRNISTRGQTAYIYIAEHTEHKTRHQHLNKPKAIVLTEQLKIRIAHLIYYNKWSPDLIAKRLAKEGEICVSHETIYKRIWIA